MSGMSKPTTTNLRVGILWREAASSPLYQPWMEAAPPGVTVEIIPAYDVVTEPPSGYDVIVTHSHYRFDELAVLRSLVDSHQSAVLVLADGILEYRNTWLNPNLPSGSLFQPAIAHKIATIGPAQSRLLENWGNAGKCEVVGLPRLDRRLESAGWFSVEGTPATIGSVQDTPTGPANRSLLVCSARTPAFDEDQWSVAMEQFRCLHRVLAGSVGADQPFNEVRWRVADRISAELGLSASELSQDSLESAIDRATAVVTTPSTVQLEAMVAHRPVAVLDFFNVPLYVPAAWHISSSEQIFSTLHQLGDPPPHRLEFQRETLRDQLFSTGPAVTRMWSLIQRMGEIARRQRMQGRPLQFPPQILERVDAFHSIPSPVNWHHFSPELTRLLAQRGVEQSPLWELTEVSAALLRARTYSEERSQLHYITETYQNAVKKYEESIAEQIAFIEHQKECLEDAQRRLTKLNERFEKSQQDLASASEKIKELAAGKSEAHERLKAAYEDAKRKQERVNELRTQNENLREETKQQWSVIRELREKMQQMHDDANQVREAYHAIKNRLEQSLREGRTEGPC